MTDCVYFLLYLALGKLSLMFLINYMSNMLMLKIYKANTLKAYTFFG